MTTFTDKIIANKQGYSEKLSQYAINRNPNIRDFGDFKEALLEEFSTTPQGKGAINFLNDDELKLLFEQSNVREVIKENVGNLEYKRIYEEVRKEEIEVQRKITLGEPVKPREILITKIQKPHKISQHIRLGKKISPYSKGFKRWTGTQARFISIRKRKKISPKQIIYEYNKQFKKEPRSASSIKTKLYRI